MNLPKKNRLNDSGIFKKVFKSNQKYVTDYFVMYTRDFENQDIPKIGIIVSKKVGCAVERNHAKRKMSTILFNNIEKLSKCSSSVIILRKPMVTVGMDKVSNIFISLINRPIHTI